MDTDKYIQSFRLQNLRPDIVYVIQVCCKNARRGHGYWSNWSTNATMRTPEDSEFTGCQFTKYKYLTTKYCIVLKQLKSFNELFTYLILIEGVLHS